MLFIFILYLYPSALFKSSFCFSISFRYMYFQYMYRPTWPTYVYIYIVANILIYSIGLSIWSIYRSIGRSTYRSTNLSPNQSIFVYYMHAGLSINYIVYPYGNITRRTILPKYFLFGYLGMVRKAIDTWNKRELSNVNWGNASGYHKKIAQKTFENIWL